MPKFEKGDKVMATHTKIGCFTGGRIYRVLEVSFTNASVRVAGGDIRKWFDASSFTLQTTSNRIAVGDTVVAKTDSRGGWYRAGEEFVVSGFCTTYDKPGLKMEGRKGKFLKSKFKLKNSEDKRMARIPTEGKFYMLVTDNGSPTVSHVEKEEARTEAQRLIRNGADRVVLLEATEVIKPLTRTETTTL